MSDKPDFLETETVIRDLLEELKKLKSATEQIEEVKDNAKTIQESANKIVSGTIELVDMGKKILGRIEEVEFRQRFDRIEQLGKGSVENSNTILNRIDRLRKQNTRLSIGLIGLFVIQIVMLVLFKLGWFPTR